MSQGSTKPAPPGGLNLYRSPVRVGILAVLAGIAYPTWWTWQLFKFTRREGFPRASSFWWTLVPVVGLVMIWRQLDDLKKAAGSKVRVYPPLIVALLVGGSVTIQVGRLVGDSLTKLVLVLLLGFLLTGLAIYLAQRSITSYLRATYPDERPRRLSVGEVVATLLSLLLSAGAGGLLYYWMVADSGPVISYLPPRHAGDRGLDPRGLDVVPRLGVRLQHPAADRMGQRELRHEGLPAEADEPYQVLR